MWRHENGIEWWVHIYHKIKEQIHILACAAAFSTTYLLLWSFHYVFESELFSSLAYIYFSKFLFFFLLTAFVSPFPSPIAASHIYVDQTVQGNQMPEQVNPTLGWEQSLLEWEEKKRFIKNINFFFFPNKEESLLVPLYSLKFCLLHFLCHESQIYNSSSSL